MALPVYDYIPQNHQFKAVKFDGTNGAEVVAWIKNNGGYARNGGSYVDILDEFLLQRGRMVRGDLAFKHPVTGKFFLVKSYDLNNFYTVKVNAASTAKKATVKK